MQYQKSFQDREIGALYLVPTPIGNLEDMTYRAVRQLQEVQYILAEDTRNSGKLLQHFQIQTPMKSFHAHSHPREIDDWVSFVQKGHSLALISDAGMPLINDPGHPLVAAFLANDIPVIALPGANAALTGLIASGLNTAKFTYYGFFPRDTKGQRECLQQVMQQEATAIFYESPYRLKKTVQQIAQQCPPQVQVAIGRELTKRHETYLRGTATEILALIGEQDVKGECVVYIQGEGQHIEQAELPDLNATETVKKLVDDLVTEQGISTKEAIKHLAKQFNMRKQDIYQRYHMTEDIKEG